LQHFRGLYRYISKQSLQNAAMVIEDIVVSVEKANSNPEYYPPDKYKKNNTGNYRAFEKDGFRVMYRYTKNTIYVMRVRHVKREPGIY
jgi:plasmid stabilization system protein ParE